MAVETPAKMNLFTAINESGKETDIQYTGIWEIVFEKMQSYDMKGKKYGRDYTQ